MTNNMDSAIFFKVFFDMFGVVKHHYRLAAGTSFRFSQKANGIMFLFWRRRNNGTKWARSFRLEQNERSIGKSEQNNGQTSRDRIL